MVILERPRPLVGYHDDRLQQWQRPTGGPVLVNGRQAIRIRPWMWHAPSVDSVGRPAGFDVVVCDVCVLAAVVRRDLDGRRFVAAHRRCGFATHFPDDLLTNL